jgi:hypothetical protein
MSSYSIVRLLCVFDGTMTCAEITDETETVMGQRRQETVNEMAAEKIALWTTASAA